MKKYTLAFLLIFSFVYSAVGMSEAPADSTDKKRSKMGTMKIKDVSGKINGEEAKLVSSLLVDDMIIVLSTNDVDDRRVKVRWNGVGLIVSLIQILKERPSDHRLDYQDFRVTVFKTDGKLVFSELFPAFIDKKGIMPVGLFNIDKKVYFIFSIYNKKEKKDYLFASLIDLEARKFDSNVMMIASVPVEDEDETENFFVTQDNGYIYVSCLRYEKTGRSSKAVVKLYSTFWVYNNEMQTVNYRNHIQLGKGLYNPTFESRKIGKDGSVLYMVKESLTKNQIKQWNAALKKRRKDKATPLPEFSIKHQLIMLGTDDGEAVAETNLDYLAGFPTVYLDDDKNEVVVFLVNSSKDGGCSGITVRSFNVTDMVVVTETEIKLNAYNFSGYKFTDLASQFLKSKVSSSNGLSKTTDDKKKKKKKKKKGEVEEEVKKEDMNKGIPYFKLPIGVVKVGDYYYFALQQYDMMFETIATTTRTANGGTITTYEIRSYYVYGDMAVIPIHSETNEPGKGVVMPDYQVLSADFGSPLSNDVVISKLDTSVVVKTHNDIYYWNTSEDKLAKAELPHETISRWYGSASYTNARFMGENCLFSWTPIRKREISYHVSRIKEKKTTDTKK